MELGCSTEYGKAEVINFLKERFPIGSYILDVGAGGGTYRNYMGFGYNMDAVELWPEAVEYIKPMYRNVYQKDIREFEYEQDYDLIIFGDIIEHLPVEDAKKVLAEASKHAKHILIGVPYHSHRGPIYGNDAEEHIQDDLTHPVFKERYPDFPLLFGYLDFYGYYYK